MAYCNRSKEKRTLELKLANFLKDSVRCLVQPEIMELESEVSPTGSLTKLTLRNTQRIVARLWHTLWMSVNFGLLQTALFLCSLLQMEMLLVGASTQYFHYVIHLHYISFQCFSLPRSDFFKSGLRQIIFFKAQTNNACSTSGRKAAN